MLSPFQMTNKIHRRIKKLKILKKISIWEKFHIFLRTPKAQGWFLQEQSLYWSFKQYKNALTMLQGTKDRNFLDQKEIHGVRRKILHHIMFSYFCGVIYYIKNSLFWDKLKEVLELIFLVEAKITLPLSFWCNGWTDLD